MLVGLISPTSGDALILGKNILTDMVNHTLRSSYFDKIVSLEMFI